MWRLFKSLMVVGLALTVFGMSAPAQQQPLPATECPMITVDCPTRPADQGMPQVVSANINGGLSDMSLTYQWSVTGGKITGGQGTPAITIEYRDVECWSSTATVKVIGLDPSCPNTASCSLEIKMGHSPFEKFDEYGALLPLEQEHERLNNFAIQLKNSPGAVGYIVFYPDRGAHAREWRSRAARARRYLIREKRIDPKRVLINGGQDDSQAIALWVVWPKSSRQPGYKIISPPPNFRVWYPKCI